MDDFFIASEDSPKGREGHKECTHHLLSLMEQHKYYLRPAKCIWMQPSMDLLGIRIEEGGNLRIDPTKLEGIHHWPTTLRSRKEVQRTMGVLTYKRAFIPGFSHTARPIFTTLQGKKPFEWTKEAELALKKLIRQVIDDPKLAQPDQDKPFEVKIDASD